MSDISAPYRPRLPLFVSPLSYQNILRFASELVQVAEGRVFIVSEEGIWTLTVDPDCPDDFCWPTPQNLPRDIAITVSNVILAMALVRAFRALETP